RWPADRWAAVARAERARGRTVVVTGGAGESRLVAEVVLRAGLRRRANLAGRTDLLGLAALVAMSGRVVCGDTGVAHLATALRTPSVVLFGPVGPDAWGPPRERPWHVALWAGQHGDPHGDVPDPGLLALAVGDVSAELAELPARKSFAAPAPGQPNWEANDRRERHALG
ncbi:MAG: glycosyl transferase, family 9, partial [Solirubrobacterales bacterium]|nr:glycosyl transferase, family 9 [Solirubrobacterales bacterium]